MRVNSLIRDLFLKSRTPPQLILVNKESMYQVIPTTIHPNRSGKRARPVFVKHRKPGKTGRKSNLMEACVLGRPVMDEK